MRRRPGEPSASAGAPAIADGHSPLILIVDDDPLIRLMMERALDAAFQIITASDGHNALELATGVLGPRLRLVVSDIRMPGLDGIELGRRLAAERPELPILFVTGYAGDIRDRPPPLQHHPFLLKPFLPSELRRQVEVLLGPRPERSAPA